QTLQQEWSAISGSGGSEIQQILNIETLVDGKLLWATILGDLGKALPQPQPAVLEGLQKADKDLVQQVDRAARRLVTLDSLSSRYDPNIAATVISPNFDAIVASNQPLTSNQPATPAWGGGGGMPMFDEFGGVMPGGDFEFNGGTGGTAETPALEG
ncbi:MAG TPA: hypothetical protein PKB10_08625, partial [Tepidisphaeraceae bacterium]|nr:hypothetical protein [Tepidisphaeraceae bacterium]